MIVLLIGSKREFVTTSRVLIRGGPTTTTSSSAWTFANASAGKNGFPVLQLNSSISRSVYVVKELLEYLCGEHSQHLGIVPCEGERVDGSGWGMNVIPREDDLLTVDVQFDAPVQTDEVFGVKAVEMTRYIRRLGTLWSA